MILKDKIQAQLRTKGKTMKWLANQLGYDDSNFGKMLSDENKLPTKLVQDISVILKMNYFHHFSEKVYLDLKSKPENS